MFAFAIANNKRPTIILTLLTCLIFAVHLVYDRNKTERTEILPSSPRVDNKRLKYVQFDQFASDKTIYLKQCEMLMKKLRNPPKQYLFKPPTRQVPLELKEAFEDFGQVQFKTARYFNNMQSDSQVHSHSNINVPIISNSALEDIQHRAKNNISYGTYGDRTIQECMEKYNDNVRDKQCLVIGTVNPWVESLALMNGASKIVTLEYTLKKYENPKLEWIHVNDYLDSLLVNKNFEQFDLSVSYSSIEHSGLGRFGDPLSPYGDLEAMQQMHCLLKPGGMLMLGLPCSEDNTTFIEFNAHRIYGKNRLNLLFKDWILIEQKKSVYDEIVFILKKK